MERRRIELETRVDLAGKNFGKRLFTGQTLEGEAVDVEAKVRLAEHDIQLAKDRLSAFEKQRERAAVVAPFDGTILSLTRIDKGSVRKGDTIAVIEQRRDRSVTAFLDQDEVLKVGLGDEALIYVPAVGETFKGVVKGIDRTSGFVKEQDQHETPGYTWRGSSDRSARIAIEFAEPHMIVDAARYRSGLPVVVIFDKRSTNSLFAEFKKRLAVSM